MPKIFVSYRHDDSKHAAGRLALELYRLGRKRDVYFDIGGRRGVEFVALYQAEAAAADVVFALISPGWNEDQRLNSGESHVRKELAAANANGVSVVPVLLDETKQPKKNEFPDALSFVFDIACERLRHESFEDDASRLFRIAIERGEDRTTLPALSVELREKLHRELNDWKRIRDGRDLTKLKPSVRSAVDRAEQAGKSAIESRYRARSAAGDLTDAAIRRARAHFPGTKDGALSFTDGTSGHYSGDADGQAPSGYGKLEHTAKAGDHIVYRGQWKHGKRNGFGEQITTSADGSSSRYEGEWVDGKQERFGERTKKGDRLVGAFRDGQLEGSAIYSWNEGQWFEGDWRAGRRHGFGVQWLGDGTALNSGEWENGQFLRS